MRTVLYRYYTKDNGQLVKSLQGKVFDNGQELIFYRDLHEHKGRLWLEEGAWNLDYRTYLWLKAHDIKSINYFWTKEKKLYVLTIKKIQMRLDRGALAVRKIGGHRQIFLPKYLFFEKKRQYSVPWITTQTDSGQEERVEDFSMPVSVFAELKKRNPELIASLKS